MLNHNAKYPIYPVDARGGVVHGSGNDIASHKSDQVGDGEPERPYTELYGHTDANDRRRRARLNGIGDIRAISVA